VALVGGSAMTLTFADNSLVQVQPRWKQTAGRC
jgi:hypothetical protein